jgi:hypothetical protein
MLNWFRTHGKWLIQTSVAIILISLLFSITLHLQHQKKEERAGSVTENNETQGQAGQTSSIGKIDAVPPHMIPEDKLADFSKEPSLSELIQRLSAMETHGRRAEEGRLAGLQVVWPVYFFSIMKREQETATVMLDASEDGFGVIIVTEISLQKYPGIATAQPGDRIWVAGKIAEVDTQGTGQIAFITEYVGLTVQKPVQ